MGESVTVSRVRAPSAEEAARDYLNLAPTSIVSIEAGHQFDALSGWREVQVGGKAVAQIRLFQRMKFRRA